MSLPITIVRPIGAVTCFLFVLSQSGCSSWRSLRREDVERELTNRRPYSVRIQRNDEWTRVYQPTVAADTLRGILHRGIHDRSLAVPIDSIRAAQVRSIRPLPTFLFAGTWVALIALALSMNRDFVVYSLR